MSHQRTHTSTASIRAILAHTDAADRLSEDDYDELVREVERALPTETSREEVFSALVQSLTARLERDPAFHQVTGSVFRLQYCERLLGAKVTAVKFELAYRRHFIKSICEGVAAGLFDDRLTEYNLEELADCLVPERDEALDYSAMETLVEWYVVRRGPGGEPLELPQTYWMRMAMELALTEDEQRRIDHAVDYYDVLSMLDR